MDSENITYYFDDINDMNLDETDNNADTDTELANLLNEFEQLATNNSSSLYEEDDI